MIKVIGEPLNIPLSPRQITHYALLLPSILKIKGKLTGFLEKERFTGRLEPDL